LYTKYSFGFQISDFEKFLLGTLKKPMQDWCFCGIVSDMQHGLRNF